MRSAAWRWLASKPDTRWGSVRPHPHSDATWPHSQEILDLNTGHLTDAQRNRIVRDNCAELYGIDVDALATRA